MNTRQWQLIYLALSYTSSNLDDLCDAFTDDGSDNLECSIGSFSRPTEKEMLDLLHLARLESNEGMKLAKTYYSLYPKEDEQTKQYLISNPKMNPEKLWDSIACTFNNWLERLREDPHKAIAMSNWQGKVTKAYFEMKGVPCPTTKVQAVNTAKLFLQKG